MYYPVPQLLINTGKIFFELIEKILKRCIDKLFMVKVSSQYWRCNVKKIIYILLAIGAIFIATTHVGHADDNCDSGGEEGGHTE